MLFGGYNIGMIDPETIIAAKKLMKDQTKKNGAPVWRLTEIAVDRGRKLAKKYGAIEDLVVISLYLAHTVFSKDIGGEIQQNHMFLSADFADNFLASRGLPINERNKVKNAIQAHHGQIEAESLEAEIVKNAEGFKFLSLEGAKEFLLDLQARGMNKEQAKKELIRKMKQKFGYLTLSDCISEARLNMDKILSSLD